MSPVTSHHEYPPFPDGVGTAPLVSISLAKLKKGDKDEFAHLFQASRELGFFYIDMVRSSLGERIIQQAESLQLLQKQSFQLPKEEKEVFNARLKTYFSYRAMETTFPDADGGLKRNESYNMLRTFGNTDPVSCPSVDLEARCLKESLGLPVGTLKNLHRFNRRSGDHIRFTQAATIPYNEKRAKGGEHMDFGTLTVLFNWLGGLHIRMPTDGRWLYMKPVPGSAIVNLGDPMVIFTAGILRSNIYRVVPPPNARLKGGLIDAQPVLDAGKCLPEIPSHEFITRRTMGDLKGVYICEGGLEQLEEYTI
ncbi:uncharacterized protein BKA55DRAFT_598254 [Fusarium redolens]|uniref:Fe2OG dioxygenase domain-containing protein n=1 Tax=Fusarium redolens TaxID=48865 RepID=A0A9P9G4A1_FUSRE|nr:uncharacterized protein BKA55DRAFT_598254 [Fusarium redolens]KAH7232246.1 hypothetical protein BKA55DRAFT_598254 [Fusarium redolens]